MVFFLSSLQVAAYLKHLFQSIYFTLYYYQEIVDLYGIYHDRKAFTRLHQNLDQYCLYQYHLIALDAKVLSRQTKYPIRISRNPPHLLAMKCFMFAILVRCLLISLFPALVASNLEQRIVIGTAFWGEQDYFYLETPIIFWSAIVCCFLQFTLSSSPLDYRSLALFRMNEKVSNKFNCFHYVNFGLTEEQFLCFDAFRRRALFAYHIINGSILSFAPVCIFGLYYQQGLLVSRPLLSVFWGSVFIFVSVCICTVIYGNLIAFIVVAWYLVIKQNAIVSQLTISLAQVPVSQISRFGSALWARLMLVSTRHAHLYEELADYCTGLWSSYLSFIFAFYIMIITFMVHIVLLSSMAAYLRFVMAIGLTAHVGLLGVIIAHCGSLVGQNRRLARRFAETVGKLRGKNLDWKSEKLLTTTHLLKIDSLARAVSLCSSDSGVHLLNGHLINYDTFRLLAVNMTIYFILFIKK